MVDPKLPPKAWSQITVKALSQLAIKASSQFAVKSSNMIFISNSLSLLKMLQRDHFKAAWSRLTAKESWYRLAVEESWSRYWRLLQLLLDASNLGSISINNHLRINIISSLETLDLKITKPLISIVNLNSPRKITVIADKRTPVGGLPPTLSGDCWSIFTNFCSSLYGNYSSIRWTYGNWKYFFV